MSSTHFYGIYTISPLHCGTGQAVGAVDLPIARESTTDLPIIPATGIKGAIRAVASSAGSARSSMEDSQQGSDDTEVASDFQSTENAEGLDWMARVFGPEVGKETRAGSLSVSDARILLLPVRSLQAVLVWVTCPLILQRLKRDVLAAGLDWCLPAIPDVKPGRAVISWIPPEGKGMPLVLEDLPLKMGPATGAIAAWWKVLRGMAPESDPLVAARLEKGMAIIADDDFQDLARRTTPVQARIRIDQERGTAEDGALWYEETVPEDTLFYTRLALVETRRRIPDGEAQSDWTRLQNLLEQRVFQLGGNATVGHGWCDVFPARRHKEAI